MCVFFLYKSVEMRSETLLKSTVDVTSIIKELFCEVVCELFKAVNTTPLAPEPTAGIFGSSTSSCRRF